MHQRFLQFISFCFLTIVSRGAVVNVQIDTGKVGSPISQMLFGTNLNDDNNGMRSTYCELLNDRSFQLLNFALGSSWTVYNALSGGSVARVSTGGDAAPLADGCPFAYPGFAQLQLPAATTGYMLMAQVCLEFARFPVVLQLFRRVFAVIGDLMECV